MNLRMCPGGKRWIWVFSFSGGYTQEPGPQIGFFVFWVDTPRSLAHSQPMEGNAKADTPVDTHLFFSFWVDTPRSLARGHFLFRVDTPRSLVLFQLLAVVNTFQRQPPIGVRVFSLGVYELPFRVDKPRSLAHSPSSSSSGQHEGQHHRETQNRVAVWGGYTQERGSPQVFGSHHRWVALARATF